MIKAALISLVFPSLFGLSHAGMCGLISVYPTLAYKLTRVTVKA